MGLDILGIQSYYDGFFLCKVFKCHFKELATKREPTHYKCLHECYNPLLTMILQAHDPLCRSPARRADNIRPPSGISDSSTGLLTKSVL